ncbi:serine protease [Burkholderia sp. JPY481]
MTVSRKTATRTATKKAASRVKAQGNALGHRVGLARAAAANALESLEGAGRVRAPSDADLERAATAIHEAAREDPAAFAFLDGSLSEERLSADLKEAFAKEPGSALSHEQRNALEAIVLLRGRPALLIHEDTFDVPEGYWEILAPFRPDAMNVIRAVGRIAIADGFPEVPYVGTGFVVGKNLVMTNAHVAEVFSARDGSGWAIKAFMKVSIDFKQEYGSAERSEFPVTGVECIHPEFDLALLRIGSVKGARLPTPIAVHKDADYAAATNTVYTVGFPAADGKRNEAAEMDRIFARVYEKKRLSPGRIIRVPPGKADFTHDCSTLGGSSGCCVVDLSTNRVIGLHYGGIYREFNSAVLLPALVNDPLLASVNFR